MSQYCSTCKEIKLESDFSKNTKVCRECASNYYRKYRKKKIEELGIKKYRKYLWEKRLRREAKNVNIKGGEINKDKIKNMKFKLIDYPDKSFPFSLSHNDFMKKYNLNIDEYLFLREIIELGKFTFF